MARDHGGKVADALFSATQRRVLGLLFGQPERSFFGNEIIEKVGAGSGAVQRELKKLEHSGLVTVQRFGKQKHYQANAGSPVFEELRGLIVKTVGLLDPVREALAPLESELTLALIYGSVADNTSTAQSDVDLLLVSDSLSLEKVFSQLAPAEAMIGRTISPTLYSQAEFEARRGERAHFLTSVLSGPVIGLFGEVPSD